MRRMIGKAQVTKNRVTNQRTQIGGKSIAESNNSVEGTDNDNSYAQTMLGPLSKFHEHGDVQTFLNAATETTSPGNMGRTKRS